MKSTTTIRSPGALALGVFFTGVTGFTIFNDVWNGAAFTIAHLNAAAALVAAIAAGHMALPALWRGQVLPALGLAVIFVASTGYIVTSAGARNAEAAQHKAAAILKTNEERTAQRAKVAEAEADVEKAKTDYDAAKQLAARECATGKGRRCDGRIETRDSAAKDLEKTESHAGLMRGRLAMLGPEARPFEGYHHAAKVFAAAGLGDAGVIEARLELLLPFVLVLISEVGTLVFLGLALGHRDNTGNRRGAEKTAATMPATVDNDNSCQQPTPPKGGNRATVPTGNSRMVASKAAAEADVIRLVARGEALPSQDTLAARWCVHKGTASKWLADFEMRGLISRHREGRAKRVVAA